MQDSSSSSTCMTSSLKMEDTSMTLGSLNIKLVPSKQHGQASSSSSSTGEKQKMVSLLKKPFPHPKDLANNNQDVHDTDSERDLHVPVKDEHPKASNSKQKFATEALEKDAKPQRRMYAKLIEQLNKDSEATLASANELQFASSAEVINDARQKALIDTSCDEPNSNSQQTKQPSTLVSLLSKSKFLPSYASSKPMQSYDPPDKVWPVGQSETVASTELLEKSSVRSSQDTTSDLQSPKEPLQEDSAGDMKIFQSLLTGSIYVEKSLNQQPGKKNQLVQEPESIDAQTEQKPEKVLSTGTVSCEQLTAQPKPFPKSVSSSPITSACSAQLATIFPAAKNMQSSTEKAKSKGHPISATNFNGFKVSLISNETVTDSPLKEANSKVPYINIQPKNEPTQNSADSEDEECWNKHDEEVDNKESYLPELRREVDALDEFPHRSPSDAETESASDYVPSPIVIVPSRSDGSLDFSSTGSPTDQDFLRRLLKAGNAEQQICQKGGRRSRRKSVDLGDQARKHVRSSPPCTKRSLESSDKGSKFNKGSIPYCQIGDAKFSRDSSSQPLPPQSESCRSVKTVPKAGITREKKNHSGETSPSDLTLKQSPPGRRLYRSLLSGNLTEVTSPIKQTGDDSMPPPRSPTGTLGRGDSRGFVSDQPQIKDAMLELVHKKKWNSALRKFTYLDKSAEAKTAFTFHLEEGEESPEIKFVDVVRCNDNDNGKEQKCDILPSYGGPARPDRRSLKFMDQSEHKERKKHSHDIAPGSSAASSSPTLRPLRPSRKRSLTTLNSPLSKPKSSKLEKICQNLWKAKATDSSTPSVGSFKDKSFCRKWRLSSTRRKKFVAMKNKHASSRSSYRLGDRLGDLVKTENHDSIEEEEAGSPVVPQSPNKPLDLSMKRKKEDFELPFSSYS